ncbi:phosphohistidine phosphatase SixA [Pseudoalteromonas phenolica]|uniref:Phosphohistidine phosphatase n=1 Tax=Pseudoalteromonas phenolica TaxID=161398 RepID=A0A0S2JZR4_9GAMM|nr:phosphohistidine phosphatase SixA [Pseudoalteromonas phenolica]ALO41515.1 Phosphohistidine phosphatase [Pseudoalteromonas phenolica]MBE0353939.1 phosphohistidine phosphatase [Pseudoalteromonas phenolica O-BC30]RXF03228.1 phosphohistidine phosphatase SixA [Pseudoalteromonas phenolica O-BC30]TMO57552.1 phosphohistidine phosphatase SixA [Pseudoalteromonas phenolica]
MKTILIMRHGEAEPMQADDASRALTPRGVSQASEMALWIKAHYQPDALLVSPFDRAQQTAAQVIKHNEVSYFEVCKDIVPSGDARFAIDYLETLMSLNPELDTWLLVAHMPIVSYLVDQLSPGDMPIFTTAGVAVIQYDEKTRRASFLKIVSPSL